MSIIFQTIEVGAFLLILVALFALAWFGKLPSLESIAKGIEIVNSKGGNIVILLAMSIVGAFATTRMFYYLTQLSVDGKLQQDNAYALMGLAFLTNQLTGAFIGALLKTMTGDTPPTTKGPNA